MTETVMWIIFACTIIAILTVDLFVVNKKAHEVSIREALIQCGFYVGLAFIFNLLIYFWKGPNTALEFLSAYLIEESLSVDNIFVFILIFGYFKIPAAYQHRILFWGIIGAIVMRGLMLSLGIALVERFDWVLYVFGLFLIYTGIKMMFGKKNEIDPAANPVTKWVSKIIPVTSRFHKQSFFVLQKGRWKATPLFVALLVVESSDLMFAVDSIPAVLGISHDLMIVYTSNIFAILGLRALYFAFAGIMPLFHYLGHGLALILTFVGVKMMIEHFVHIPIGLALGVIVSILALSIAASLAIPKKRSRKEPGKTKRKTKATKRGKP